MAIKESEISNLDELIKNFKILCLVRKERNIDTISSQQSVASYSELKQEPANCKTNDDSNLYIPNDVYKEINAFLKWPMNKKKDVLKVRKKNNVINHFKTTYTIELLNIEKQIFTISKTAKIIIIKSFEFSCICKDSQARYCFFCNQKVSDSLQMFYEHIHTFTHIQNLKKMILHHKCFDIALKYMEETNNYWKCYKCEMLLLKYHENMKLHNRNKTDKKIFSDCCEQSKSQCNLLLKEFDNYWYNIHQYACIPCKKQFKIKLSFLYHIDNLHKHAKNIVYDFCLPCALLWISNGREYCFSFSIHCRNEMHKFLINSLDFVIGELPSRAKELLEHVEETAENLFKLSETALKSDLIEKNFLNPLKSLLNTEFPRLKMYPFGSRIAGLGFASSDVDIFIDCEGIAYECNNYYRLSSITNYMDIIKKCLQQDKDIWDVQEILKKCRVPIIKLRHRQTGLQCDLSFSNGLSVENTKLIKSINKACPQGRKLILFVKKWLSRCTLPGYHCITNYALAWLVIFYLQIEKFLPSIDTLIKRKNKSKLISGWETGVDHDIQDIVVNKSFDQLLREFFTFYGHFNYRDYVICPLIADTVEKKYFIDIFKLPKAMNLYIEYIQESAINTNFRIDSSICLQDPFDLSHNLTKAVEPLTLRAFKKYCKLSANILNNMI
ncbi:terminal uridylyltransferase 4-like isoform X1 [Vespa mandarinia]|uniref:terminal uridylyltransferase 4-like isoform X1 n=1 Tax=Vespa mandarinia TaxID=7446 RepID=UPI001613EC0C|nr:terminal uridylyltransferase 4-like isoform X1 [Vespa mandarinia]XP_035740602.1 terminal uridylyltransferase 4-like isoform X1 [Vespa mandarinia]